jgi:hypothetical protein
MFKVNHLVRVYINGKMEVYIVGSSKKALSMEKENGEKLQIIQNATDLKVNIQMIKRMAQVPLLGSQGIFIMVLISMMNVWDMVKCTGLMDQSTKVNGKKVSKTVVVSCHSPMGESKMAILKIMFSKEIHK